MWEPAPSSPTNWNSMSCTTVPESQSSLESPECGRSAAEATSQTLKRSSAWIQNEIPQEILNSDFFVFHNSLGEIDNPVLYPVWFIHAKQHNRTICEIRNVLFAYWKRNNHVPEYLFSNIVITQIMRSSPEVEKKMPYLNSD